MEANAGAYTIVGVAILLGVLSLVALHPKGAEKPSNRVNGRADQPDSLIVPEGLEAELWAETPLLYNPTNIDVDEEGRVWAVETVNYRDFNNPPEERLSHPEGERIVILEDVDGDGRADTSKTFVQDEELVSPLGIAVFGEQVVVSASPSIIIYTDTNGDDKADEKETFLTGFGGLDHDHGLHAVTAGPDGRWYFNAGNAGPHIVTDKEGWTLRAGSIYSGGTPYMEDNQPKLVSDDGRVWVGGVQLRVKPDGTGLEVLSHNYRNPYELAVDSYGDLWTNDNDDQVMTCRAMWVMEGANAGYFSATGSRTWQTDRRPGQDAFTAHWHQEDPGVIPAGDNTGAGAPTGIVRYESDALGDSFRGMLLSAESGRNVIFGFEPEARGAGFQMNRTPFASSISQEALAESFEGYKWDEVEQDKRRWFRPSDVAVGTDGAVYIADWYDPVVGGHQMQDSIGYGRIYRITPKGKNLQAPEIDLSTTEGQIQALLSPAKNVRYLGFQKLKERSVVKEIKEILDADNPFHRARAIWLLVQLGKEGRDEVETVLRSSDEEQLRVTAFRALKQVLPQREMLRLAEEAANDSSVVRREAAIFLRDIPLQESRAAMVALAERYDGEDRWDLEAFGLAAEGEESATYDLLRQELGVSSDPARWSDKWADLVWRLHPVKATEALKQRALSDEIPWEEKKRAMVALGFINDRQAVAAMEELAASGSDQVAKRAQWWIDYRKTNDWHDLKDWDAEAVSAEELAELRRIRELRQRTTETSLPISEREAAVKELAGSVQGSRHLISLVIENEVPSDLRRAVRQSVLESPDRTVRVLAQHYLTPTERTQQPSLEQVAAVGGDPDQGQMLYYAKCAVCHRVGETGVDVGPDLTQIKTKFGQSDLINAILHPDDGVAHGYYPWRISTESGKVLFGFLMAENDATIVIKDANGQEHVIERARIVSRERLGEVSLMPGPSELQLSAQDVADLAAFLASIED